MNLEQIFSHWKDKVSESKKSEQFDLTNESIWLQKIENIKTDFQKLESTLDPEEIRFLLQDIFRKQLYATGLRLIGSIINDGDANDLEEIKKLVIEIKTSENFDNSWSKKLYDVIAKKYQSIQNMLGAEKLCLNTIGELFGKFHPNMPVYNACSRNILEKLGYDKVSNYQDFLNSFNDFKEKYQNSIGKLSEDKLPITLEIDQLFNYFDKDVDAKNFISEKKDSSKFWVWAVESESWDVVKQKNIWASRSVKIQDKINAKDKVIFYVKGTHEFRGIYEFVGKWYDSDKTTWREEDDGTVLKEIKLNPITFGNVDFHDLIGIVEFLPHNNDKRIEALPLQASGGNPSNNGKPISRKDYELILKRLKESNSTPYEVTLEEEKVVELKEKLLQNKQIVLYGPPGTSKTFTARKIATLLISGTNTDSDDESKQIFEKLQKDGQVELVQFHPSYSYEDFVQGIKPKPIQGGGISYAIRNGIFKKLCDKSEDGSEFSAVVKSYQKIQNPFALEQLGIQLEYGCTEIQKDDFAKIITKINSDSQLTPTLNPLDQFSNFFIIKVNSNDDTNDALEKRFIFKKIIPGSNELFTKLENGPMPFVYFDADNGGVFGYGILDDPTSEKKPRVLIIDEINRGNLSKIFGELIYALEYRDEKIRLQYSDFDDDTTNDFLKIPENLYIIGTMNTADRSISLFDTAMRRRFAFIPLMIDYDLILKKLDIGFSNFTEEQDAIKQKLTDTITDKQRRELLSLLALYKINEKIRKDLRMGKEKQIGHTYLLKILEDEKQYLNVWKYKILPLLEEFYSSKFEDLQKILIEEILDEQMGLKDFGVEDLDKLLNSLV